MSDQKNIEFKEEYWHDALEVLQQEEAWESALEVLEREEAWQNALAVIKSQERKLFLRRTAPVILGGLLLLGGFLATQFSSSKKATSILAESTSIPIDWFADRMESNKNTATYSVNSTEEYEEATDFSNENFALATNNKEQRSNDLSTEKELNSTNNNQGIDDSSDVDRTGSKDQPPVVLAVKKDKVKNPDLWDLNLDFSKKYFLSNLLPARTGIMDFLPIRYPKPLLVKASLRDEYRDVQTAFSSNHERICVLIGTSQLTGFGANGGEFLNPLVGLEYRRSLSSKWSYSAGLEYFSIEGMNHQLTVEQSHTDGFTAQNISTVYTSQKLHYAHVPLNMYWHIDKRSALSMGMALSYLVNNESVVLEENDENGLTTEESSENITGYFDGYKRLSPSISAGYEFRITPSSYFNISYEYGLQEITKDEFYNPQNSDRNSRLRLTYKLAVR